MVWVNYSNLQGNKINFVNIINYICSDISVVQITTIRSGFNSISVSWISSTGDSDTCTTIAVYHVTFTSHNQGGVHSTMNVTKKSHNFTGLPENTLYDFFLYGESLNGIITEVERRIVRTFESMCTYILTYMYILLCLCV